MTTWVVLNLETEEFFFKKYTTTVLKSRSAAVVQGATPRARELLEFELLAKDSCEQHSHGLVNDGERSNRSSCPQRPHAQRANRFCSPTSRRQLLFLPTAAARAAREPLFLPAAAARAARDEKSIPDVEASLSTRRRVIKKRTAWSALPHAHLRARIAPVVRGWHAPTRFKWDSLSPNAGILHADGAQRGKKKSWLFSG